MLKFEGEIKQMLIWQCLCSIFLKIRFILKLLLTKDFKWNNIRKYKENSNN